MFNLKVALAIGATALAGLAVAAPKAEAGYRHGCCGPLPTVHTVSNVNKISHVTHYSDVYKKRYYDRPQYFEHTTIVHPLVYVNNVIRVHHEAIGIIRPVYRTYSEAAAPEYFYSTSTVNLPEVCCCK